jgi:catechol 2,3-dioxygenase-like lactoylglutathione lyase family enzyme
LTPRISGLHHLTVLVDDLDASIAWYETALLASHLRRLDHHDGGGARFAVILQIPGVDTLVQLRLAPAGAPLQREEPPITYEVADDDALEQWWAHFEAAGIDHSGVRRRRTGRALDCTSPGGIRVCLYTAPPGGFDAVPFVERAR